MFPIIAMCFLDLMATECFEDFSIAFTSQLYVFSVILWRQTSNFLSFVYSLCASKSRQIPCHRPPPHIKDFAEHPNKIPAGRAQPLLTLSYLIKQIYIFIFPAGPRINRMCMCQDAAERQRPALVSIPNRVAFVLLRGRSVIIE